MYYIREFMYSLEQEQWVVSGQKIPGGVENARISAISDRRSLGHIRLYFQGNDNGVWESYWNGNTWTHSKSLSLGT